MSWPYVNIMNGVWTKKMANILLFPESDRGGPDSNRRCNSGLSRIVENGLGHYKTYHALKIYRCWTVYGHSWRVVWLPIVLWLGSLTSLVLVTYSDSQLFVGTTPDPGTKGLLSHLNDTVTGFYSTNIATNLFSTGMTTLFCFVI